MRRSEPALVFVVLLTLVCCEQKAARTAPAAAVADAKSAVIVVDALPLWTISQGTLKQVETIPVGEIVALTGQTQTVNQSGRDREFLGVRRESGTEGLVRSDFVVSRAILSVITGESATIYSAPANTAASTESIPRMTIVAVHSDTGGMRFVRVTCFDPVSKMLRKGVYLRNEGVSPRPSDVQAAILLQLSAASRSATQRRAFLTSALKDYSDSVFTRDIQAALDALAAPAAGPTPDTAPVPPPSPTPAPAPPPATEPAPPAAAPSQ